MEIKNGDFASFLEKPKNAQPHKVTAHADTDQTRSQSLIEQPEIFDGEAFAEMLMDDEKLEAYAAQMRADTLEQGDIEPMSDEEFERQALEAGGDDDDAKTPE